MNRLQASNISGKVMEQLKLLESELGVTFSRGTGKYDDATFSLTVTATENSSDGKSQDKDSLDLSRYASSLGLTPEDLERDFKIMGDAYVLCGFKSRNRKYPFIAKKTLTGSKVKMSVDMVMQALGKN